MDHGAEVIAEAVAIEIFSPVHYLPADREAVATRFGPAEVLPITVRIGYDNRWQ